MSNLKQISKHKLIVMVRKFEERLAALEKDNVGARKRIEELEAELARLRKNSSNSSKPPSSDIVKPPRKGPDGKRGKKRKIGGQPGHVKHERTAFTPQEINAVWKHALDGCPKCGGALQNAKDAPRVIQQVELVEKPVRINEHRGLAYWCPRCRKVHYAPLPDEIRKGGLVGVRLTALVAYLKGVCHASYTSIQDLLDSVMGFELSRGQLAKLVARNSTALLGAYDELLSRLRLESVLNIDETGHNKMGGKRWWTWVFRAELFSLFKIAPSRGSEVLVEVLGEEFAGVIGADYFSAYRKYMKDFNVLVQFCMAHLIRDVKFLMTCADRATRNYGRRLRECLRKLFRVIHRREEMTAAGFDRAMQRARKNILRVAKRPPQMSSEARNMANRFRKHGAAYFRFITTPGLEPTNNLAEQAIRFVVIDRHVTQGTRGETGRQWSERIWTVIATCAQQGRSVFEFLHQTVYAYFTGHTAPSLLPNSS